MNINITDLEGIYTKRIIKLYEDTPKVTGFFRSFFPDDVSQTLELSTLIQRETEKIAVDVPRGTDGNRNSFNKYTEKALIPPYYREFFDITGMSIYDRAANIAQSGDLAAFAQMINGNAKKMMKLKNKIERTLELQCASVLLTGMYQSATAGLFNFKRKAASLVNNAAYYFSANNDYRLPFKAGAEFLRTKGKVQGGRMNVIMGTDAFEAMKINTYFLQGQNLFNMQLDSIKPPQAQSTGAVLQGYISAGSWMFNIWTYPEYYDDATNTSTQYMDPKMVIILPEQPDFVTGFGAVPMLPNGGGTYQPQGAFTFGEYLDPRAKTIILDIECAALAIPVSVDKIFTFKAVA